MTVPHTLSKTAAFGFWNIGTSFPNYSSLWGLTALALFSDNPIPTLQPLGAAERILGAVCTSVIIQEMLLAGNGFRKML